MNWRPNRFVWSAKKDGTPGLRRSVSIAFRRMVG